MTTAAVGGAREAIGLPEARRPADLFEAPDGWRKTMSAANQPASTRDWLGQAA